jgi:hypothetical protein
MIGFLDMSHLPLDGLGRPACQRTFHPFPLFTVMNGFSNGAAIEIAEATFGNMIRPFCQVVDLATVF